MQTNVLEYLERGALARCPDGVAARSDDSTCTYRELADWARSCAADLCQRVSATRQPIAVYLPKHWQVIVADLGILYSGNCYSNLDVNSPPQRMRAILDNLQPAAVITSADLLPKLVALGFPLERLVTLAEIQSVAAAIPAEASAAALANRRASALDTDPVCIINTSGSTGIPKSVAMNHRNVIDFIDWTLETFTFGPRDVFGSLSPFYFDIYTLELYVALATGASISIIPDSLAPFPAKLVEHLAKNHVTFLFWVPSVMVNIANMGLLDKFDLSALTRVFFAGEVFPTRQFNLWRRALPQAQFVNLYGPIEITVDCTYYIIDREFADNEPLPIGIPCRNTEILILDANDRPAGAGQTGELCVRGSSLAMGYWNNPERTAAAFVQNPLNTAYPEMIYRTGDLASWNERGEIMFAGRKDYQIKHMGYRIELGEIETAVTSIGEISAGCVVYNAEQKEITLFYSSENDLSPGEIRKRLAPALPGYMLPRVFHRLDVMPLNPNGKIDRHHLHQRLNRRDSRTNTVSAHSHGPLTSDPSPARGEGNSGAKSAGK
ncbi:MAG: amino acid adenylation domain-containing protein [Planctomycetia bacterium]|nr:amino acid adenylation domain-containing protein [Planctomycetia bacterium]